MSATQTVTIAAYNDATGCFEVTDREQLPAPVDLSQVELSAHDLGCKPGALHRVAIVDEHNNEIKAVEVEAR